MVTTMDRDKVEEFVLALHRNGLVYVGSAVAEELKKNPELARMLKDVEVRENKCLEPEAMVTVPRFSPTQLFEMPIITPPEWQDLFKEPPVAIRTF